MKKATTVEQQIATLVERGMDIDVGENKAKEILNDIGYFRLGFYCFPFEKTYPNKKNRIHQYKQGTKFSDVVQLYYFDADLRNLLTCYLSRIELNFRTNIIYTVSNKHVNSNTWFIDHSVMKKEFIDKFDNEFYTDKFRGNYRVIAEHHKKYINDKYAPAWKTLEFLTFGRLVDLYRSLKDVDLQKQIASRYGIRNEKILKNYFYALVDVRNVCAHSSVLFDYKLKRLLRNGPAMTVATIKSSLQVFSVIRVVHFILNSISENRAKKMKTEITTLFDTHQANESIRWIINDCMGYRRDVW